MDGAKDSVLSEDEEAFAEAPHTLVPLQHSQEVAFQGIEQADFLSISRLDRPFPHIRLICCDLGELFLTAIRITFASRLLLPRTEAGLLSFTTHFAYH